MAIQANLRGQPEYIPQYNFAGSIAVGGTAQSLLPLQRGRVSLAIQNTSAGPLTLGIGGATATATITSGTVSSIAVVNGGRGYTFPPLVRFRGGGPHDGLVDGLGGGLDFPGPNGQPAQAHAVLTVGAVSSIVVDFAGAGYVGAPYVQLINDPRDPYGGFAPSATSGLLLVAGSTYVIKDAVSHTEQINIFGATTGQTFECGVIF
jgi:hypothetical protein